VAAAVLLSDVIVLLIEYNEDDDDGDMRSPTDLVFVVIMIIDRYREDVLEKVDDAAVLLGELRGVTTWTKKR
jgi:hypothetical protein